MVTLKSPRFGSYWKSYKKKMFIMHLLISPVLSVRGQQINSRAHFHEILYYRVLRNFVEICHQVLGPGWLSRYSDSLRAGRSGDRIPVGLKFSAPVQTGPGTHPASYTMGTGSFPGVKRPGRGVDRPPPSSAEIEGRVELYLYSPSGPSWPVIGRAFTFTA